MDGQQDADEIEASQLSLAETERIITRLEEVVGKRRVVLVGGQAVAVWTAYLENRLTDGLIATQVASGDIDFLGDAEDVRQTAIEIDLLLDESRQVRVWVMHPERCMESRVHNSALPSKQTDLAWRQLQASILCARAFSQLLLDERGPAATRDVLRLNERIFRFAQSDRCGRIALERGIEIFDATLEDDRLPEKFRTIRLPQMQEHIRALRRQDRQRQTPP